MARAVADDPHVTVTSLQDASISKVGPPCFSMIVVKGIISMRRLKLRRIYLDISIASALFLTCQALLLRSGSIDDTDDMSRQREGSSPKPAAWLCSRGGCFMGWHGIKVEATRGTWDLEGLLRKTTREPLT